MIQQVLQSTGSEQLASGLQILLVLTLMALGPTILVLTTSFTRIIVVLSLTRQAMGTPNIPPNIVLIPLALFLTVLSMGPTLDQVYNDAVEPSLNGKLTPLEAYAKAAEPLRAFMRRQTRQKEVSMLMEAAHLPPVDSIEQIPDRVLVPAFALSELKTALIMGFVVFLSFMAVDLVVAGVLMALGMFMVPPSMISLPMKILLFVMADGWNLIVHGLLSSIR